MCKAWKLSLALTAVLGSGGCVTVDPQESFESAADVVAARTGLEPAWPRDAKAQALVEARVEVLLAEPLTADSAAQIALLHNPRLRAELAELGIAQADLAQASRLPNPGLHITYQEPDRGGGSKVEWTLIDDVLAAALTPLRRRVARSELERVKLEAGQAMLDLTVETRVAFYDFQASAQLVDRVAKIRELAEAGAEMAQRQRQAGTASELDALQQQALRTDAQVALLDAEARLSAARERLIRQLGLPDAEGGWELEPELPPLPAEEPPFADLERLALDRRLDVAAARYAVDAVGHALALRKGTRFFPAGVGIGVGREDEVDGTRLTGPVLDIELPLFDTGAASVARLEAFHSRAQAQLEALSVKVRSEVRETRDRLRATRKTTEAYRNALLPQRLAILEETQRRYNMMLEGVYELILARQLHLAAERGYIESWRNYWIARARLVAAVGGALPGDGDARRDHE